MVQPRQFEDIETAIETFNRWELFYNNRRLHGSLGNIAPKQQWNKWLEKMNREILPMISANALSTKLADEKSSNLSSETILVDKVLNEQKSANFENQESKKSQTVFENLSSL